PLAGRPVRARWFPSVPRPLPDGCFYGQGRLAVLRGARGAGRAELVVRVELGHVVQLLQRAVAREGRVALGIGQDVPGGTVPPAKLADPDAAFGGQAARWPHERTGDPGTADLAGGQAGRPHRRRVQRDLDTRVGPGQRDGTAERGPRVDLVARRVEDDDPVGAPA